MKSLPENPDHLHNVNTTHAVPHKDGTPRLPHERDEAPDPKAIDRSNMHPPGNKTPSRDRADN